MKATRKPIPVYAIKYSKSNAETLEQVMQTFNVIFEKRPA